MIRRMIVVLLITSLLISLLPGCGSSGAENDTDIEKVTEEEKTEIWEGLERETTARKEVMSYLLDCSFNRGKECYDDFSSLIITSTYQCDVRFEGENLLSVHALGYGLDLNLEKWRFYNNSGSWYYHEDTGIVEAGNELAEELLAYIESYEPEVLPPSEVCDLLRDDLQNKVLSSQSFQAPLLLDKYYPVMQIPNNCKAERDDNGLWTIESLGYGYDEEAGEWKYYESGGVWYYDENEDEIEPGNDMAENLLKYIEGFDENSMEK